MIVFYTSLSSQRDHPNSLGICKPPPIHAVYGDAGGLKSQLAADTPGFGGGLMRLDVVDEPTDEDRAAIVAPLRQYNALHGPLLEVRPLAVVLRDGAGNAAGGLWGRTAYDWLFVELLAVPEDMRGTGAGTALMHAAEAVALERGCIGAWLDTFAFQARPFYERLGYSVFGELVDHPKGSARYFLMKRFS